MPVLVDAVPVELVPVAGLVEVVVVAPLGVVAAPAPVDVAGSGLVTVTTVFDDPQPANTTAATATTIGVRRTAAA